MVKEEILKSSISPDRVQLRLFRTGHSVEANVSVHGENRAGCTVNLAELKAAIERLESRETVVHGVTVQPGASDGDVDFSYPAPLHPVSRGLNHCLIFDGDEIDALIEAIQRAAGRD